MEDLQIRYGGSSDCWGRPFRLHRVNFPIAEPRRPQAGQSKGPHLHMPGLSEVHQACYWVSARLCYALLQVSTRSMSDSRKGSHCAKLGQP